ncbi:translation initiation factor IF-2-like [Prionailurus bengalensis]|uniref:translation initiation factor IF-2-like n=1 Tax=Prionailurus bengalensis TaxID=37029 RepID=UPI001CA832E2|nr:translation initiation factor IF-2-like [Prionailurus bengalensis]
MCCKRSNNTLTQAASPRGRSASPFAVRTQTVWLPATESNSVPSSAQAASTRRQTSPHRPSPAPSPTNLLRTPRLAPSDPAVLRAPQSARRWSRRRACHILFSGSRSGARATRSHTHTAARGSRDPGPGAPDARRGTWGLRTPSARLRSCCRWPPPPPPRSLPAPPREPRATRARVPGGLRDHLPRARAARRRAAAAGAAGARPRAGAALRLAPRRAPHCSRQRGGGGGGGADAAGRREVAPSAPRAPGPPGGVHGGTLPGCAPSPASGRGATADLGCVGRCGRRGCLKRHASPWPPPAASPSSSEGYLHPHRPGRPAGTQVPRASGMQECEQAASGPAEVSLCVPRLNTPSRLAAGRATCAGGSAREPAGWGAGERSILPGPLTPFVPPARPPAPRSGELLRGALGSGLDLGTSHFPLAKGRPPSPGKEFRRGPHLAAPSPPPAPSPGRIGKFSGRWRQRLLAGRVENPPRKRAATVGQAAGGGGWGRREPQIRCRSARVRNVHLSPRPSCPSREAAAGPGTGDRAALCLLVKHAPLNFNVARSVRACGFGPPSFPGGPLADRELYRCGGASSWS